MTNKSMRYRLYAAECREIADLLSSGELRSQLLNIAAEWEMLATEAQRKSSYQPYDDDASWSWSKR
jgi:hypothetical protein